MSRARLRLRAVLDGVRRPPTPALLVLAAIDWMLFAWSASGSHDLSAGGMAHHPAPPGTGAPHAGHGSAISFAWLMPGLGMWLAMVLAMSPPLLIRQIGALWRTSLRRNRVLKSVLFLYGYLLTWALTGLVAVPLAAAITGNPTLVWASVVAVIGWHLCPPRRRALNRCHRAPMTAAFGADAYRDALRCGLGSGVLCVAVCGPAMVLVLLAGQFHLVAMAVAAVLLTIERFLPARRRIGISIGPGVRAGFGSGMGADMSPPSLSPSRQRI